MIAEFESDLARPAPEMEWPVANARGRLRGKKPNSARTRKPTWVELHREGRHTTSELAELFNIARSTVYRAIRRAESAQRPSIGP